MNHTFACKHAYLTRETGENQVVLCDQAGTPDFSQYKSIVGCMCVYQPPCPQKHLCALAKGWENCWRLQQERREEEQRQTLEASESAKKSEVPAKKAAKRGKKNA